VQLEADVLSKLRAYHWPGNLRQLASVLRTASAMLAAHENRVDWMHLPDDLVAELHTAPVGTPTVRTPDHTDVGADNNSLEQHARQLVRQALQTSGGNVSQAARTLGISRQTLYKKMQQL
jgi:transcriptional regulator of acetoin/glycerol metabolism